jgi:hypothetical protein
MRVSWCDLLDRHDLLSQNLSRRFGHALGALCEREGGGAVSQAKTKRAGK